MSKKLLAVSALAVLTISTGFAHCGSCGTKDKKVEAKKACPTATAKKVCPVTKMKKACPAVVTAKKECPVNSEKKMCPKKAAKVAEFLDVSDMKGQYAASLDAALGSIRKAAKKNDNPQSRMLSIVMDKFFAKYMSYDVVKPLFVKSFSDVFTIEEVDALIKFYKTDTGKMLVKKQPVLVNKMNTMVMEIFNKHQPDLQKMVQEEFAKANKK